METIGQAKMRSSTIPDWVQSRLETFERKNLDKLDLSVIGHDLTFWTPLTQIPSDILEMSHLRHLDLGGHQIDHIPVGIHKLENLEYLRIDGPFAKLPDTIGSLEKLKTLSLSGETKEIRYGKGRFGTRVGNFADIPPSIGFLPSLCDLQLCGSFKDVPAVIGNLRSLNSLSLYGKFTSLPNELSKLVGLTELRLGGSYTIFPTWINELSLLLELDLFGNYEFINGDFTSLESLTDLFLIGDFASISGTIEALSSLKRLSLWGRLTAIPEAICNLRHLTHLDLSHNNLTDISKNLLNLANLQKLILTDNEVVNTQSTIVDHGPYANLQRIRMYLQGMANSNDEWDYLYEAKLLILGEPDAGKTTLERKIQNPDYIVKPIDSTDGVDVSRWDFTTDDNRKIRTNIWDFGGHEIYHAVHQFFLTKRSLYAVVTDNRKEDTDFYYWLNTIELLGGESPIAIIMNERNERKRYFDGRLRDRFPNIVTVLSTNFMTNRGFDQLLKEVKRHISQLPHIGQKLPRDWVKVREALEKDARNYVLIEEYHRYCVEFGITEPEIQNELIGILSDLGVCLYWPMEPSLRRIIILNPEWGTKAVYAVLDHEQVINNRGKFTKANLIDIWSDIAFKAVQDELLTLMKKFAICYEIPSKQDHFIAPHLLPPDRPHYEWNPEDNRIVRFQYRFMPKGIISRLIVALNRLIDGDKLWKHGVVIKNGETYAEVTESYHDRQIRVILSGSNKRGTFSIIKYQLDEIHQGFSGLQCDAKVPCNCKGCSKSNRPHEFNYEFLQRAIEADTTVQCEMTLVHLNPRQLLDDVLPAQAGIATHVNVTGSSPQIIIYSGDNRMELDNRKFETTIGGIGKAGNINTGDQTFGDHATITLNINALPEAVGGSSMAELKDLLQQLQDALQQLTPEQAEDAQLVQECADDAIEEAAKDKPSRKRLEIKGESLVKAAQNLLTVAPIARDIAMKLIGIA